MLKIRAFAGVFAFLFLVAAAPPAQPAGYVVHFTMPDNHIHVPLQVDGRTYNFIFDTGGAASMMPGVETELHLPVEGHGRLAGAGGSTTLVDLVRAHTVDLGGAQLGNVRFVVLAGAIAVSAKSFDGIIGREFFPGYAITIDYQTQTLTLTPVAQFAAPEDVMPVTLSLRGGVIPNVEAFVDGRPGAFDLDTGSSFGLTLTQHFVQDAGLSQDMPSPRPLFLGVGAGGDVTATVGRVASLTIGDSTIANPVAAIAAPAGVFADNDLSGNIGPDVLKRFTVMLDFPAKTAYFVPNATLGDRMPFNRAGLFIKRASADTFVAAMVWPNSPASEAGIAQGDEIVSIDGGPPTDARRVQTWTKPAGTAVIVAFKHGGETLQKRLVLRDLL